MAAAGLVAGLLRARGRRAQKERVALRATAIYTSPDEALPWWERLSKPKVELGIGIWAEKLNMTTIFDGGMTGKAIPATILVIKRGGNMITMKKWPEKHGFFSVEVGYDRYSPEPWETSGPLKDLRAPRLAYLAANGLPPMKKFKQFRMRPQDWVKWDVGDKVWPSEIFKEGDVVDIHGVTKEKGVKSTVQMYWAKRGPKTLGSKHYRRRGTMGNGFRRTPPGRKMAAWSGGMRHNQLCVKIHKIIDKIDEDNMPETIMVVQGSVAGYTAHWETGGSYVHMHKARNRITIDGRWKRDPVWMWFFPKGEGVDPYVPLKGKVWTRKTIFGRDQRWYYTERNKYWPDGFPGYDHSSDPFYDDCDTHKAMKAPEW